jgi:hypothetical protein
MEGSRRQKYRSLSEKKSREGWENKKVFISHSVLSKWEGLKVMTDEVEGK